MSVDVAALQRENSELRETIRKLVEQIAKLNDRVTELLAIAQRKQRKRSSASDEPKTKKTAPASVVTQEQREAFDARPNPPKLPEKPKREKKQQRRTGRNPVPDHLEAEEHDLRPSSCEHCGSTALDVAEELVEEKLHIVKEHQRRRVVRRTTCRCRACFERTTPTSLPAPYTRSKVTCEWLAWLIFQKFGGARSAGGEPSPPKRHVMLAPLDRVRRDLAERGVPLAMGTLVGFVERAADILAPVDGLHWRKLLAGSWMATDGTGIKVLVPKLPEAHDGYIEIYRNNECAVFQYAPHKGGEDVVAKLSRFCGTLTADAEHRFNDVYKSGRVREAGCNAHGRRKFRDAEDVQPDLAKEGGAFIAAMYVAEESAKKDGLTGPALLAHRQATTRPIADEFATWLAAVQPTLLPSDPLNEAVAYYRNHWAALTRFIDDPEVPIDNSPTEREFQNFAKLRLGMLFAGSSEGAHRAAVLLGIVATCRALGVHVQEYLTWAFERLGTHREHFSLTLEQMTPAAFKASRG